MTLHLGPGLDLPDSAATETFGLLGTRGAGKSNAIVVLAEEMYAAGIPWVAVDPKGDWWGIRSGTDGTSPGLPVPIFGGLHGDLDLEPSAGAFLADLVVDQNLTCLLDVSQLSKGERARLLVAFADRLYRRHQADPTVRHLFLEEAHDYIPQTVMAGDAQLKEAVSRLVLYGRAFGLGATVASQRSARLHKDVLTQVSTLLAMRNLAAQDRKAIEGWVREHAVAVDLLASLPTLQPGEAWLWSPSWLGKVERVTFRQRRTFDSGSTPAVGAGTRRPATLAEVDLAAVKTAMAETIERAKADDPKALRQRITQLETELAAARKPQPPTGLDQAVAATIQAHADSVGSAADTVGHSLAILQDTLDRLREAVRTATVPGAVTTVVAPSAPTQPESTTTAGRSSLATPPPAAADDADPSGGGQLGKAERTILTVLAQQGALTVAQVARLSRYSSKSGGFRNALTKLRRAGNITGERGGRIEATATGIRNLGTWEPIPTGRALIDWWNAELGKAERAILAVAIDVWPKPIAVADVAAATGYSASSGGFRNALSRLRTLELVAGRGELTAADELAKAARD